MRFLIGRLRLAKRLFAGTDEARHLSLRRLRKAHRAQILAILEDMQAEPGGEDRYLAVHPAGKPERYVQCLIEDDDKALCEIASGFYLTVEGEPRQYLLGPKQLEAIAALGFSTDSNDGNHQRLIDFAPPNDIGLVADIILAAVHSAFGVDRDSRLDVNSPWAAT